MTEKDVRDTVGAVSLPRPRPAADDDIEQATTRTAAPEAAPAPDPVAPHLPWPEPWGSSRAARPRTEFWDFTTASWRSRGPVAAPPKAD